MNATLIAVWAASAVALIGLRRREPLGVVTLWGAICGAAAAWGGRVAGPLGLALLPAASLHLLVGLPDGRLPTRSRQVAVIAGHAAAAAIGGAFAIQRSGPPVWVLILEAATAFAVAWPLSNQRYRQVPDDRQRMQWFGTAVTLSAGVVAATLASRLLLGWPPHEPEIVAAALIPVPISIVLGTSSRLVHRIDRVLAATISLVGLCVVVVTVYLGIVLGLGRVPNEQEGQLLFLSMLAAAVCALLYSPVRRWLVAYAERRVYGQSREPRTVLGNFGTRLSRAIPLEELLLQLAEALTQSLRLRTAEVWTGSAGSLERAASVPDLPPAHLDLGAAEQPVVAHAGVAGPAWLRIWLPQLLEGRPEGAPLRVAPITHAGNLLGLMVVERSAGGEVFGESDEQSLAQLARQIGLALHNSQLDSALQSSLEEVRRQAEELRASRKRIVAAGDAERRKLERNLHDGAQQHLVALAVRIRLVQKLLEGDVDAAQGMLREIGEELKDAVAELRTLAHGIYPPLLMDRGLGEALRAAAQRASLPTSVEADGIGRYPQEVEAAAYFCCLEALQNAGKHAGEGAEARVRLWEEAGALLFEVADDGAGFEPGTRRPGAGFVNMGDRLGSVGGTLDVDAAAGQGVRVRGRLPLEVPAVPAPAVAEGVG
ncbi:MAG: GAF domain-containing sensor histidine kinase [Candidatus Dormibacteria bacterium]